MPRYIILLFVLAAIVASPAMASDRYRVYPANYELVQLTGDGESVLASGRALLRPGGAAVSSDDGQEGDYAATPGVRLAFTLDKAPSPEAGAPERLSLGTEVTVDAVLGTEKREMSISPGNYITGPKRVRAEHSTRSLRAVGDPTPIVSTFEGDGERFRLTVLMEPR